MEKITTLRTPLLLATGVAALLGVALLSPKGGKGGSRPVHPVSGPGHGQAAQQIDLVIALDTSGSMNGLIDGARQQLWDTVAQLGRAQPRPSLRVGLIAYGSPEYGAESGYVKVLSDLTSDLDSVYGQLFALRISGGDEYVARSLQAATRMSWSAQGAATRRMFIVAGNEPADQDPQVALPAALGAARELGISVHTIYCGAEGRGESALWRKLAEDGAGKFAAIDHNAAVAVASPVDGELARLSAALNRTYVAYGKAGGAKVQNQAAQDQNAAQLGGAAAASRAMAKSSALYRNSDWDLVDASKEGGLAKIPVSELPAELQGMSEAQRQEFLSKKAKEREELQQRISELSAQRTEHVKAARKAKPRASKDFADAMQSLF